MVLLRQCEQRTEVNKKRGGNGLDGEKRRARGRSRGSPLLITVTRKRHWTTRKNETAWQQNSREVQVGGDRFAGNTGKQKEDGDTDRTPLSNSDTEEKKTGTQAHGSNGVGRKKAAEPAFSLRTKSSKGNIRKSRFRRTPVDQKEMNSGYKA